MWHRRLSHQHLLETPEAEMMGIAPVACFGLMVVGAILYQIDARAAGGFLHPSSTVMANLVLWRWGIVCLIAGVFGWVLMACAEAMRPPALPRWWDEYPEEDEEEEEEPPSQ
jgi:hypothetical protein